MIEESVIRQWREHIAKLGDAKTGGELFILLCLNDIERLRDRIHELENVCHVANQAECAIDEWLGQASTRQAALDSLWRLRQALRQAGYTYDRDNLDWRGSILKELNDAGFYPNTTDPYHATKPEFVYDPEAPNNKRIFGNAVGPTIAEIVRAWKDAKS